MTWIPDHPPVDACLYLQAGNLGRVRSTVWTARLV
jgi:hypothetical protein